MKQSTDTRTHSSHTETTHLVSSLENAPIPDVLKERIRRYRETLLEDIASENMNEFLNILHESLGSDQIFSREEWEKKIERKGQARKDSFLLAIDACADDFKGYGMTILWNTLAALGTRKDPHKETSILAIKETLPYPWYICDAALHAMGKSFALHFHVQSKIFAETGAMLLHGCGCTHYIPGPEEFEEMEIRFKLPQRLYAKCAQEFLDHLLAEATAIVRLGYPFRLNPEHMRSTEVLGLRFLGNH